MSGLAASRGHIWPSMRWWAPFCLYVTRLLDCVHHIIDSGRSIRVSTVFTRGFCFNKQVRNIQCVRASKVTGKVAGTVYL